MLSSLITWLNILGITGWRDFLEIGILSILIYSISSWLAKDSTRPLLGLFFGYVAITFICRALSLTTLSSLLITGAPIAALLAIIFHQDALQRKIVMYRNRIRYSPTEPTDWLELSMRSALIALNQGKEWFIIIEHQHELASVVRAEIALGIPLTDQILSLATSSSLYKASSALWVKSNGTLQGINVEWQVNDHSQWQDQLTKELPLWKQDALLMTLKTDAIVCKALPEWRAFDVIIAGKIFEQITATQALMLMKKHLNYHSATPEGGITYETSSATSTREQRAP